MYFQAGEISLSRFDACGQWLDTCTLDREQEKLLAHRPEALAAALEQAFGCPSGIGVVVSQSFRAGARSVDWVKSGGAADFLGRFKCCVALGNACEAAVLSQAWYGDKSSDAVIMAMDEDIALCAVSKGRVIRGLDSGIGHLKPDLRRKRPCDCGKYGCIKNYLTRSGFVKSAEEWVGREMTPSNLKQLDRIDADDIIAFAWGGDKMSADLLADFCDLVGCTLAELACLFHPARIIIFSSFLEGNKDSLEKIRQGFEKYMYPPMAQVAFSYGNDLSWQKCFGGAALWFYEYSPWTDSKEIGKNDIEKDKEWGGQTGCV